MADKSQKVRRLAAGLLVAAALGGTAGVLAPTAFAKATCCASCGGSKTVCCTASGSCYCTASGNGCGVNCPNGGDWGKSCD
jgi:hypothetical protein